MVGWFTSHDVCAHFQLDWPEIRATFGRRQCIHSNYDWSIKIFGPQGKERLVVSSIRIQRFLTATSNEQQQLNEFVEFNLLALFLLFHNFSVSIPTCICIRVGAGAQIGGTINGVISSFCTRLLRALPVVTLFMHSFLTNSRIQWYACALNLQY